MTVLLTVAVRPKDGLKPYLLMGSDSLQIKGHSIFSDDGEVMDVEVVSRDENYQKIFKVNDKLIGITGRYNEELTSLLVTYLKDNDTQIKELTQLALNYVREYITNDDSIEYQRVTVTMGSCENSRPRISYIEVDTRDLPETIIDVCEVGKIGSFVPVFAGNRKNTKDLQEAFNGRVLNDGINFNITVVRRAAKEYLEKAAARYPETCNQNIVFERLR